MIPKRFAMNLKGQRVKRLGAFLYKENPRIVRGFKKGFADEQKRAEEKAITIRQKRGGKARIEKQAEN